MQKEYTKLFSITLQPGISKIHNASYSSWQWFRRVFPCLSLLIRLFSRQRHWISSFFCYFYCSTGYCGKTSSQPWNTTGPRISSDVSTPWWCIQNNLLHYSISAVGSFFAPGQEQDNDDFWRYTVAHKPKLGMGPNLVRVRKLEFLYRVLEVRRSSKFGSRAGIFQILHKKGSFFKKNIFVFKSSQTFC